MKTTRASLLVRVKNRDDNEAWGEFHKLYAPLPYRYTRGCGLSRADAEEVRDQCLEVATRKMPTFEYDKDKGGFKNWLRGGFLSVGASCGAARERSQNNLTGFWRLALCSKAKASSN